MQRIGGAVSVIFEEDGLTVTETQPEGLAPLLLARARDDAWLSRSEVERLRDALTEWLRT